MTIASRGRSTKMAEIKGASAAGAGRSRPQHHLARAVTALAVVVAGAIGLVLAGAWTDTGWPDTMEGAVRSGLAAAAELSRTVLPSASKTGASRIGERQ